LPYENSGIIATRFCLKHLQNIIAALGLGHFALYLRQHACHSPVALGVAAELPLGPDAVQSRAGRAGSIILALYSHSLLAAALTMPTRLFSRA
jgi:hypothetical protein